MFSYAHRIKFKRGLIYTTIPHKSLLLGAYLSTGTTLHFPCYIFTCKLYLITCPFQYTPNVVMWEKLQFLKIHMVFVEDICRGMSSLPSHTCFHKLCINIGIWTYHLRDRLWEIGKLKCCLWRKFQLYT